MSLIETVPTTSVTVPTFLRRADNGKLPDGWMRAPDGSTRADFRMFLPVSYAMTALHLLALRDGIDLRTTGRYRTYARQVALFKERYSPTPLAGRPTKWWNGQTWWLKPGMAMAATPGTSNHGLALADDLAEEDDGDTAVESIDDSTLEWLRDNAPACGFALETRKERWHWHWIGGDRLSQLVVDVLAVCGVAIPDLSGFGFAVPAPTPPTTPEEDDDMSFTDADRAKVDAIYNAMFIKNPANPETSIVHQVTQTHTIMSTFWDAFPDGVIKDAKGSLARTIKRIADRLGVATS